MNLDLVRSFLVVLEEGSLNRAAVRLHLAQSSLTRQMQALEHEMDGRLLERTTSGVAPTAAGQSLAEGMRRVLADFDHAVAEARRLARGQQSVLRVGYLLSLTRTYLNPALSVMRKSHPEVQVRLLNLNPGEQVEALRSGEIDIGLIGRWGAVLASEFYTRRVATLRIVAALSETHRLAERTELNLGDLRGEMFIGAPESDVPGHDRWVLQMCRKAGFRPRFVQAGDSLAHALSLVVSENAVGLFPQFVSDEAAPGVVMRPIADAHAKWDFLVVWQRGRATAPMRALLDALASAQASPPPPAQPKQGQKPVPYATN